MNHLVRRALAAGLVAAAALLAGCGGGGSDPEAERINGLREAKNTVALAEAAGRADTRTSCLAVRALGYLGPQAQPEIETAMKDPRREVRAEAALAYPGVVREMSAPPLATLVRRDPEPAVRAAAATALGRLRAVDEIETLLAAVEDPDPLVRRRAGDAIARIMGRVYDFSGTPQDRQEAAAEVRQRWHVEARILREYHQQQRGPQPK